MEITVLSFVYMILLVFNIKKNSRKFPNKGKIRLLGGEGEARNFINKLFKSCERAQSPRLTYV